MTENEDHIRRRAYEIWEQEGRPQGEDLNHWVKALQQIAAEADRKPRKAAAPKKAAPVKAAKSGKKSADKPATPSPAVAAAARAKSTRAKATTSATRH